MNYKKTAIQLSVSLVFLLCGLFIYLATRSGTYVNAMFDFIAFLPQIHPEGFIGTALYNWGADFLWVVAFIIALDCFTEYSVSAAAIVFGLGSGFEFLQLFGVTTGTFDVFDIVAEFIAALLTLACLVAGRKALNQCEQRNTEKRKK